MTTNSATPIVKSTQLSHGTLEIRHFAASRRFYEEFLGLECVRHTKPAMCIRKGSAWHIICVEVGDKVHPQHIMNHWGIDVASREEVDLAYRAALEHQKTYGIKKVTRPGDQHGAYSFYIEDLDSNWWEIQHAPNQHEEFFSREDLGGV
jgi:catechol 2,3-dioxygenase-like lactoylglutathione lyase family enzyme